MRIAPVALNNVSIMSFERKKRAAFSIPVQAEEDTFSRREDTYTKRYKELLREANRKMRLDDVQKTYISAKDIEFLMEIKDDKKFKSLITMPVAASDKNDEEFINIFLFTDADATRKLAKRLGDRTALKKLLSQKYGYGDRTVFFAIAENDDVKKAKALQENLSAKEFKKFMSAKDYLYETPYSIAQEKDGALKALLDPIFASET